MSRRSSEGAKAEGGPYEGNYTPDAIDDAFLRAVRDGVTDSPSPPQGERDGVRGKLGKSGRSRMKRAGRPNVPKTFGSRSR